MDTNVSLTMEISCNLLDIDYTDITNLTRDQLKKKYHRMALQHHPDKNGNTAEATKYFQKINEAYHYLYAIVDGNDSKTNSNTNNPFVSSFHSESGNYIHLLSIFIFSIIKSKDNYRDAISNIIHMIVNGCKEISFKLFDELDKDHSLELYDFICRYKNILYISDDIITQVRDIIIAKFSNDKIYSLNPSVDDLFENNIYKLIIDEVLYLVPLWHNELYFDAAGHDIIVFCMPDLPENVSIDDQNNIIINITYNLTSDLLEQSYINYELSSKQIFYIPINQLYIRPVQQYIIKGKGISRIIDDDIYNIKHKSDIIFRIKLL
jgi:hypothetical protein